MKLNELSSFTVRLLSELGYTNIPKVDIVSAKSEDVDITPIIVWLEVQYKIEYEFLEEYHDRSIRGGTWRNVHKFTIRTSPACSHSWTSRVFDKVLQRVLFEIKQGDIIK